MAFQNLWEGYSMPRRYGEEFGIVADNGECICDLQAALVRLDGDQELFRKLVEFYDEDYPRIFERLKSAISAGRAAEVERAAHSLKNLAATFDGHYATEGARHMEELGRTGNLDEASRCLEPLGAQLQQLRAALAAYVAASNS
jgi:HPt (histidine-containing phosphotransfer) domain-containing protein